MGKNGVDLTQSTDFVRTSVMEICFPYSGLGPWSSPFRRQPSARRSPYDDGSSTQSRVYPDYDKTNGDFIWPSDLWRDNVPRTNKLTDGNNIRWIVL